MRFAIVCASNMNRSMDAHNLLKAEGLDVESYGVGTQGTLRDEKPIPPGHHQRGPFARSRAPGADSRGTQCGSAEGKPVPGGDFPPREAPAAAARLGGGGSCPWWNLSFSRSSGGGRAASGRSLAEGAGGEGPLGDSRRDSGKLLFKMYFQS